MANASPTPTPTIRIGIFGQDEPSRERHGCGLWPAGIAPSLTAADALPVLLGDPADRPWADVLEGVHGVVVVSHDHSSRRQHPAVEALCQWCQEQQFPLLAIDHGLHALNTCFGGTVHLDLPRDLPEALQHRHPPERGLRHAINVLPDTLLANLYGEGEVVVNSEHRRAIQRVARGFRLSAQALDGVVEAIEYEGEWFALGVQWNPASPTASGLDIQLFRGLIEAANRRCSEALAGLVAA